MGEALRLAVRIAVGLAGMVAIAIGVSALSKLRHSELDSPRWQFVLFGAVGLIAGAGLIWSALVGLHAGDPPTREHD